MIYDNLIKNKNNKINIENKVYYHFVNGPFVEIKGNKEAQYRVEFIDTDTDNIVYTTNIKNNCWCKCNKEYFINWKIKIYENENVWFEHSYNAENKKVYIALDSKSLGDTLAWFPYLEEFRKKHNCKLIVSTFMNELFLDGYANIEFIKPGDIVSDLYAMYCIGVFYNDNSSINLFKNPTDPKKVTLQKMCSDILGLEYIEIRPNIYTSYKKQVCIGIHGTAQSKFWNNPNGWQDVVDWLNGRGYNVKLLSKEGDNYMGNKLPDGIVKHPNGPIELVMDEMLKSKAFIGIGSGLSWLSWSLNIPTILISGFSYEWAEMKDCIRITAPNEVCQGCFNRYKLDINDWNWCPEHKGTEREFECSKRITSEMVIKELEKFL
jgi:autotransporter strand-loop-strand O-heptosyltransferase